MNKEPLLSNKDRFVTAEEVRNRMLSHPSLAEYHRKQNILSYMAGMRFMGYIIIATWIIYRFHNGLL